MRASVFAVLLASITANLFGQSQTQPLAFEVASIKPHQSDDVRFRGFAFPADRFEATNVPLRDLVAVAFGQPGIPPVMLNTDRISGGPSWILTDGFDVIAKATTGVPLGAAGAGPKMLMLRTLLAERFNLRLHHEMREMPIYALLLARNDGRLGPELHRSETACPDTSVAPLSEQNAPCALQGTLSTMLARGQTMAAVAELFSAMTHRVVVDHSGLAGRFDFDVKFRPERPQPSSSNQSNQPTANDDLPSIFTVLEEQLGLRLDSTRGPVDVLVIDHVERPTED